MNFKTMSPITILIIITLVLVGTVGVIYAVGQLAVIPTSGTVIATSAFLTVSPSTLTWGTIERDSLQTITLLVTNTGGTDTEILSINNNLPSGLLLTPDSTAPIVAGTGRNIVFTLTAGPTAPLGLFESTVTIDG